MYQETGTNRPTALFCDYSTAITATIQQKILIKLSLIKIILLSKPIIKNI